MVAALQLINQQNSKTNQNKPYMWKKKTKEYTYVVLFSNTLIHIKYFLYHYLVENVQIHTQAHKQDKASASKQEVSDDTTAVIATYKHTAHFLLLHFVPVMSSKV